MNVIDSTNLGHLLQKIRQKYISFGPGSAIPNSTNLNTFTNPGFYYCATGDQAKGMTNVPPSVTKDTSAFLLLNIKPYDTDVDNVGGDGVNNSYKVAQIALSGASLLPSIRFQSGTSTWTTWHKCLTTETVMNLLWSGSCSGGNITVDILDYLVFAAITSSGQYMLGMKNGNEIKFFGASSATNPNDVLISAWWAQYTDSSKSLLYVSYRESRLLNPSISNSGTITRIYGIA